MTGHTRAEEAAPDDTGNTGRKAALASSAAVGVLLVALYGLWPDFRSFVNEMWTVLSAGDTQRLGDWVQNYGYFGPVLIIILMVVQMFLIVAPSWLLMVIATLAYGPLWGALLSIAAVMTASAVGYAVGVLLGQGSLERLLGESKSRAVRRETERYGVWAIVVARLNPMLSNDAISFLGGAFGLGFIRFMAATLAGITPLAAAIAAFGEEWETMKTGLLVLSVLSLAGLVAKIIVDRKSDGHP